MTVVSGWNWPCKLSWRTFLSFVTTKARQMLNDLIWSSWFNTGMIRLPLGDYQAIIFSSPVFTMIMSVFLIKDRFGVYRAVLALLLTIGIIVICRPSSLFPQGKWVSQWKFYNLSLSSFLDSPPSPSPQGGNSSKMFYLDVDTLDHDKSPTDLIGILFALAGAIFSPSSFSFSS